MERQTSSNALVLDVDTEDHFDVREIVVEDGLSRLYSAEIVALSQNPAVAFELIIGKAAELQVRVSDNVLAGERAPRYRGIVAEIHQLRSEDTGLSTYRLKVVPRLFLLQHRTNCRVFQQMTDLDVARAILSEWGIEPTVEVARPAKTRKYRVQYQETDYAFFCRLLESAGITFYFRRDEAAELLVLTDGPERGGRRKNTLGCTNEPMGRDHLFATEFQAHRAVRSGRLTFADHDHRLPNRPLLGQAEARPTAVEANLEEYRYVPGAFRYGSKGPKDTPHADDRGRTRTDPDEAKRLAEQAAAARVAATKNFSFESNALDLAPGTVLLMTDHPLAEREGPMLITHITLKGTYENEPRVLCRAVCADAAYAPEAVTPSPSIFGVETAVVVGPSGETIHCDEFGRVRVQFHWDRYGNMDELSSCWVPVNQPWAGDGLGAINLPRIGQEVIVSFLGGNPEEPVIVGRIYTNLLRPPFSLPQNKTQNGFRSASVPQTGGFNEVMFEDKAGQELLRMRAEKDMATRVNNDQSLSVGKNRKASIEANDTEEVLGNQKKTVEGDKMSSVLGQVVSAVGKDQLTNVLGSMVSMAGGERIQQTVGASSQHAMSHQISSLTGTTITCGQSMIYIGPDSIIIQSPKVLLNPGEETAASVALGGAVPTLSE